ncbi:RICIN domain-containing protein [Verrucomicrobiales bacterium]|nr:RICIN domain-containing protein [Verrucomicrobiales bacterium]
MISLAILISSLLMLPETFAETIEITASRDGYEVVRLPSKENHPSRTEELEGVEPTTYFPILSKASGNAVAVSLANKANGEGVIEWTSRKSHEQQWRIVRFEGEDEFQLQARHSNKALAVREGKKEAGADIIQWQSIPGRQMWKMEFDGDGYVRLINQNSGHDLSLRMSHGQRGKRLIQAERADTDDQKWLFQLVDIVE